MCERIPIKCRRSWGISADITTLPLLTVLVMTQACASQSAPPTEAPSARSASPQSSKPPSAEAKQRENTAALAPSEAPQPQPASMAPLGEQTTPKEDELQAYERARPIFEQYCGGCHASRGLHASKGTLTHFDMDRYPFGGHHAHEITRTIREVLGANGAAPTMPRDEPGKVQGEDLRLILAWADAYDRAHPKTMRPHDGHESHHH